MAAVPPDYLISIEERSNFSAETLTNINGKIRHRELVEPDPDERLAAYLVVTLLIGAANDQPLFGQIDSVQAMQEVLKKVASMRSEYLMAFDLLWSPQVEIDTLTEAELAKEYTDLVAI